MDGPLAILGEKNHNMKTLLTLSFCLVALMTQAQHTLTITMEHTIKDEGQLMIALFNSEEDFLKKPAIAMTFPITEDGSYEIKNIPSGEYAVSIVHDKDGSGQLEFDANGRPVEPYGFSNDAPSNYGPPQYRDAQITIEADTTISINVQ